MTSLYIAIVLERFSFFKKEHEFQISNNPSSVMPHFQKFMQDTKKDLDSMTRMLESSNRETSTCNNPFMLISMALQHHYSKQYASAVELNSKCNSMAE